jgi:hypothetical protein
MDGITAISDAGMKTWFRDNTRKSKSLLGTFDSVNGEYNITLEYDASNSESYVDKTLSFNEGAKGFVSFKSFVPQAGVSVSGKYITSSINNIWEHYRDTDESGNTIAYNNFYGTQYESSFNVVFNDMPSVVKHFNIINYEGTQSKVNKNIQDKQYYNLEDKKGWYVDSFKTDLQTGDVPEFIEKENKWFNRIRGEQTSISNVDTSEFTVQGLGTVVAVGGEFEEQQFNFVVQSEPDDSLAVVSTDNSSSSTEG